MLQELDVNCSPVRRLSSFGLLLVMVSCLVGCGSDCSDCWPQPYKSQASGGGTDPPSVSLVHVAVSQYIPSGGVFVLVDVGNPMEDNPPYDNWGYSKMWVGTGDDTVEPPDMAPSYEPQVSSGEFSDLNHPFRWGGGVVIRRPEGHTKVWVFIQVELRRTNPPENPKRWFKTTVPFLNNDLPSGWVEVPAQ